MLTYDDAQKSLTLVEMKVFEAIAGSESSESILGLALALHMSEKEVEIVVERLLEKKFVLPAGHVWYAPCRYLSLVELPEKSVAVEQK